MNSGLKLIISREYLSRVKRKSFIISTLLVPLLMIGLSAAPALVMLLSSPENRVVAVVDESGSLAGRLSDNGEVRFVESSASLDSLRADEDFDAILVLGPDVVKRPGQSITLYTRGAIAMATNGYISQQLEGAIEDVRLESYDIPGIKQILADVQVDLDYPTIRIDKEEDTASSATLSYFIGLVLDMMLYMFILIYGQMVMNSIIEEKNNRVLEIVVSSVKPTSLMLGKIVGVGLVAITQILLWAVILGACSLWTVPMLSDLSANDGGAELAAVAGQLSDTGFLASLFVYLVLFFIGGYLFYSAIYAAIGSAVDNVQDASQLSTIATMPVIIGIVASMAILNNPNSTLSFWVSVFPFTSPMAMMSRLPYGVPLWEILLSLVVLYASFMAMIWLCAKIYRVGIFMYGKKPSLMEIIRWARYK